MPNYSTLTVREPRADAVRALRDENGLKSVDEALHEVLKDAGIA